MMKVWFFIAVLSASIPVLATPSGNRLKWAEGAITQLMQKAPDAVIPSALNIEDTELCLGDALGAIGVLVPYRYGKDDYVYAINHRSGGAGTVVVHLHKKDNGMEAFVWTNSGGWNKKVIERVRVCLSP